MTNLQIVLVLFAVWGYACYSFGRRTARTGGAS